MLKDLLNKGKCKLGFHKGEWMYQSPDACVQTQTCERCGHQKQRTQHIWGEWAYQSESACNQIRTCGRCGESETQIMHNWGSPQYKCAHSCIQVQNCTRCGIEQQVAPKHIWEKWEYRSSGDCTQAQICSRCGAMSQHNRIIHDYDVWHYSEEHHGAIRICKRCHEVFVKPHKPENTQPDTKTEQTTQTHTSSHQQIPQSVKSIPQPSSQLDQRLVGHWRCTRSLGYGSFGFVQDWHLILKEDGSFITYCHKTDGSAASGINQKLTTGNQGQWSISKNLLHFVTDEGESDNQGYEIHGNNLFLSQGGVGVLWERV